MISLASAGCMFVLVYGWMRRDQEITLALVMGRKHLSLTGSASSWRPWVLFAAKSKVFVCHFSILEMNGGYAENG